MRISVTLDDRTVQILRRRAEERNQSVSPYLAEMAVAEAQREDDALAEEGYRLLTPDTQDFADNALGVVRQDWK